MNKHKVLRFREGFRIAIKNACAEAAEMVIPPGESEGNAANRHVGADQWLFVVSGTGNARIGERRIRLKAGSLLLIERGTTHEIRNTGSQLLRTLNFYAPPAFASSGKALPAGRR